MKAKEKEDTRGNDEKEVLEVQPVTYTKKQLLASKKYQERKDLLQALLKTGEKYTISEVEQKIKKFMEGKVK